MFRIMDNLPVAMVKTRKDENGQPIKAYERGYHVGFPAQLDVRGAQWTWAGGCSYLHVHIGAAQRHVP